MQAEGFLNSRQRHPVSLTAAVALNVAAVGAVMLAKNDYSPAVPTILIGENIPLPKDPPPLPDKPQPKAKTETYLDSVAPLRPIPLTPLDKIVVAVPHYDGAAAGDFPTGIESGIKPTVRDPVLVGAQPDPRFARDLQPAYPPGKQRLGEEGSVTVRIFVGADGRVKQVEPVGTVDPDFWAVTEKQALKRWRFTPATRDGVPYDSWRQMTVRFRLDT